MLDEVIADIKRERQQAQEPEDQTGVQWKQRGHGGGRSRVAAG